MFISINLARVYIYIYMRHPQSCEQFQVCPQQRVAVSRTPTVEDLTCPQKGPTQIQIFTLHAFIESTPVFWGVCVRGDTPFSIPISFVSFWLRKQNTLSCSNMLSRYSPKTHMVCVFGETPFSRPNSFVSFWLRKQNNLSWNSI